LKLDRYKTHDIDIVIDRWIIGENASESRMEKSLRTAMEMGEGIIGIQKLGSTDIEYFSKNLMDAETGHSWHYRNRIHFHSTLQKEAARTVKDWERLKRSIQIILLIIRNYQSTREVYYHWKISNPINGFWHRSKIFLKSSDWE
jgi:excinuclease ABC subunit A